jgi:hypothetical protein
MRSHARGQKRAKGGDALDPETPTSNWRSHAAKQNPGGACSPDQDVRHRSRPLSPPTGNRRRHAPRRSLRSLVSSSGDPSTRPGRPALAGLPMSASILQSFPSSRVSSALQVCLDRRPAPHLSLRTNQKREGVVASYYASSQSKVVRTAKRGRRSSQTWSRHSLFNHRIQHKQAAFQHSRPKAPRSSSIDGPLCNPLSRSDHQAEDVCRIAIDCPSNRSTLYSDHRDEPSIEKDRRTCRSSRRSAPSSNTDSLDGWPGDFPRPTQGGREGVSRRLPVQRRQNLARSVAE